jgi:hypothetical protein
MEKHFKALGILYILFGAFTILLVISLLAKSMGDGLVLPIQSTNEISHYVLTAAFSLLILISVLQVVVGYGFLQRRPWVFSLSYLLGAINLFSFPFGTAIGIYSFWVLSKPDARALLSPKHTSI